MKTYSKFKRTAIVLSLLMAALGKESKAQLTQMGIQYFQNQYLGNPAMAGIEAGLNLNIGYRQQWNSMPGAPVTQYFTADNSMSKKVGLGLNLYNDAAGLIKKSKLMGTFAYHLPLNNEDQVHFGISLGFMFERFLTEDINGDPNDLSVERFGQRENFIDGDFGIAYTSKRLTIQAAVPNLKIFLRKDINNTVDRSTFFTALSYKWPLGDNFHAASIEPKVCYRGVRGYDNMWDVGANVTISNNQVYFSGMYHTSRNSTFGLGFNYLQSMSIFGMYTTENAPLRKDSNGIFEIGLKYYLMKK